MRDLSVAKVTAAGLAFHPVNVYQAFRASLQAWLDTTSRSQAELSRLSGVDKSTITKILKNTDQGVEFDTLERLRVAMDIPVHALFHPDYFALPGVQDVRSAPLDRLPQHQPVPGEGEVSQRANDPYRAALDGVWELLTDEQRDQVLKQAIALARSSTSSFGVG
jgi:hypothetical protein